MSVIHETYKNSDGVIIENFIDLAPVEKCEKLVNEAVDTKNFLLPQECYQLIKNMDKRQLEYLAVIMMGGLLDKARVLDFSFSEKGREMTEKLKGIRDMAKKAGYDLWPELG